MSKFTATAFMCVFNEADILPWTIRHLIDQGIGVHVIDNRSTDGSDCIARDFPLVGFDTFPEGNDPHLFEWRKLLQCVEKLAYLSNARWCIHHDADEIRRSPLAGEYMIDALNRVDRQGYNAVNHQVLCFHPVDEEYRGDPEGHFQYFSEDGVDNKLDHLKAWKNDQHVVLSASGGHRADFQGRKVAPERFILKHYPIRSSAHGARKVLSERMARFDPAERAMNWHVQYNELAVSQRWTRDSTTLNIWTRK